jgi:hypothetical protein
MTGLALIAGPRRSDISGSERRESGDRYRYARN